MDEVFDRMFELLGFQSDDRRNRLEGQISA
jgi:hypothetical protein